MSERSPDDPRDTPERGSHNKLGYRNVDEEGEYDEQGSQGPGAGEPPPDEENPGDCA
jgi:hypothetical protein